MVNMLVLINQNKGTVENIKGLYKNCDNNKILPLADIKRSIFG